MLTVFNSELSNTRRTDSDRISISQSQFLSPIQRFAVIPSAWIDIRQKNVLQIVPEIGSGFNLNLKEKESPKLNFLK